MKPGIFLLFFINAFAAIEYSLVAPLYPSLSKSRGVGESLCGFIFSIFPISNLIAIPFVPKAINLIGRKNLLYVAVVISATCTFGFALVNVIENYFLFVLVSLIIRFIQGVGSAFSETLVYSIAASKCESEDEMKKTMGYCELAYSLGLTLGPIIASSLYFFGGFSFPFLVCGFIEIFCVKFINNMEIKEEDNSEENTEDDNNNTNFLTILFKKEIFITFIAIVINMICNTFYFPVLTKHLFDKFGLGIEVSSVFFVISMFSNFLTLQFINLITNKIGNKLTITLGLLINILFIPFISPVSIFPQELILVIVGLSVTGITSAFVLIVGIVDLMETMKNNFMMDLVAANDVSIAMFVMSNNFGDAFGPLIGGYFTQYYSFDFSCYVVSLLSLVYSFVFIFYNCNSLRNKIPTFNLLEIDTDLEDEKKYKLIL